MANTENTSFSKKEAIDFGFKTAKENIIFFIGLFVIWAVITILTSSIQSTLTAGRQPLISFLFTLITWIINSVVSMGLVNITLKFVDNKKPDFKDIYYVTKLFNYILASVIRSLIVLVGFVLLIIPGIIFSIKLQFVGYFIVDKKMDAVDSIKASWEITKGVKWNLFLLGILLGLINVLGFLCLLIGLVITVPLSMVAEAYVYRKLLSQSTFK